jgi:hypothetical protein
MQIKETSEDPRLRALKKPMDLAAETREAEQLQPMPPARPVTDRRESHTRVQGDRRKGERRKEQRKVLLDTRSYRDRRTRVRRAEDRISPGAGAPPNPDPRGIDVEC